MSARNRQDALLRSLDPLPEAPAGRDDAAALLEALALAHPRTASTQPAGPVRRRRAGRRLGALALAAACVAGGGVAVAGGGVLDDIGSGWSSMFGTAPASAPQPRLVARGTGSDSGPAPVDLQLYVEAPPGDPRCAAVRASTFRFDTCSDGRTPLGLSPLQGLTGGAGYQAFRTSLADCAYGRVDPAQVSTIRLAAPDRAPVSTAVDPTTGYWVTSIIDTTAGSPVTLSALDRTGRVLATQVLAYSG